MTDPRIVERLGSESRITGAHEPFFLDDSDKVFFIEEGYANVFGAEVDADRNVVGRWPFMTRLDAGAMTFGTSFRGGAGENSFGLVAVPSQQSAIVEGRRSGVESIEAFDLDTTIWIEAWVTRFSEYLARDAGPPPPGTLLLEADPDVSCPAGASLGARHLDVVWAWADRPMRFLGREDLTVQPGSPPLPLTEATWLEIDEDARVSALYTPTVFLQQRIWPSIDLFNGMIRAYALAARKRRAEALAARHRGAVEVREASAEAMFRGLGGVLGSARRRDAFVAGAHDAVRAAAGDTPLRVATGIVARFTGAVEGDIPPRAARAGEPLVRAVDGLVRSAGLRAREIALAPGWQQRCGPSFVGQRGEDLAPVALLADDDGYRAVDPVSGEAVPVGRRTAAEIADRGIMLYAPLPSHIRDGKAALLHFLGGFGRDFRGIVAMATLGGLLALVTPVLTGRLLAEVVPRVDTPMWIAFLGALFLAALGTAVFDAVRALALLRIESRLDERLQSAVWSRLLSLPTAFFRRYTVGDLADRANGISRIREVLTGVIASAVIGGVFSVFSFALLFFYSWSLALVATASLAVLMAATAVFAQAQMRHLRTAFTVQGAIDGLVFQMIVGISKLRIANAENYALLRWAERFAEQKRETLAARRWTAGQLTFNSMFVAASSMAIFAFIFFALVRDRPDPSFGLADFLSFNAAFGQLIVSMTALTTAWATAVTVIPLFERVGPILEARPENVEAAIDPGELTGDIEFSNVFFRYLPEAPNAVDGVSFHIRAGEFVAFVGASGSGKSTLYRLILGFETPDAGSVFIDGLNVASLDLAAVRARMGVVLQEGHTIAASILENVSGGTPLPLDRAWEAIRAAGLGDDVEAMPMGIHTVLPEGGVGLSGGQKQRLLIARALARKPRIVLLDEATSALDNRTQAIVQKTLDGIAATRVVIAHRLTTVQDAERIYVMDAGRIVEVGGYEELMKRDGVFARLARRQLL